ncbi:MAG: serine hydrolase [Planctomycetota bacterium]|jgi:CubicO group peptidase (beta-lactamase class C family)
MRPTPLALAVMLVAAVAAPARARSDEPTLQDRLDRLVERLEAAREEMHVPGMAIAVVKDDEVVLCRGFGVADLESGAPATDETLFAVGSTTKAFTATLVGMLVDEGFMGWDDPVRRHLPAYRIRDAEADERVVVRDLLCHRIGFASMTLLWYGQDITRREVLETALRAELLHPFRERFNYSNVSYLAAGLAAAEAAGTDWDTLLAERIFAPLGMTASNTTRAAALADSRMATGYLWRDREADHVHQPMRDVAAVAPAGAINSSARDMAQWVRFQLGRGTYEGTSLLSEARHAVTWERHIGIGGGVDYGLGWFLRDWRGHRVIEHAGGIDGFTAEVAMIPEESLGFVLLMNRFASPLQEASRGIVFGTMLGPLTDDAPVEEDFEPYVGTYLADFGPFDDAEFEVLVQNGRLAVDVPGQMIFELEPPDDEGRRRFRVTDAVAVRFERDERDEVWAATLFQGGMAFEIIRAGHEPPVEIDLDAARRYLGRYHSEQLDADVTVTIHRNRLALDVPGQMVFDLHPPDDEGRWVFRARETIWATFETDADGGIVAMSTSQDGVESRLPRVAAAPDVDKPPPGRDELLRLVREARGGAAADALASVRGTGTIELVHMGVSGTVETFADRGGRWRDDIDFGRFGRAVTVVDGDRGWTDSPALRDLDLHGEMLEQAQRQSPFVWLDDWRTWFDRVEVTERTEFEGEPVYAVAVDPPLGSASRVYVSAATGLPVARVASQSNPFGMVIEVTYRYGDYRPVGGALMPHRVEMENDISGRAVVRYDSLEPNGTPPPDAFRLGSADEAG